MCKVYGYCRISRKTQSIDRQIRNIKACYPDAVIVEEAYTGTRLDRPVWTKLFKQLKKGDVLVFDSVSRMSRNAEDGSKTYIELFNKGVELVFLKEPYINTETYKRALNGQIELTGTDIDLILEGVNRYLLRLAEDQIKLAFEQAEKEVEDLHQRTKEGIETARLNGKQIGQQAGRKLEIKKKKPTMDKIRQYSRDFDGSLSDADVIKLIGIARNTYYKYKKEMTEEA